ncbi:MAG: TetR/AcrR family transcriptional regulator [Myxococcales bacterium]|nr:TetR/AcrR family transcriptional regulator [Myxococcales bacterium]
METTSRGEDHTTWYGRRKDDRPLARLDRNDWIRTAFDALCEGGVDEVRISTLCAALGVTKGSFYWHFDDRDALLRAMLEGWERVGTEEIIEALDGAEGTAAERLRRLVGAAFGESSRADRIEAAIRAWASRDEAAAATVARVDARRLAYVRDLLRGAGVSRAIATHRSAILYRTLIGELTWRSHGGEPLGRAALEQLVCMLLQPA